MAKIDRAITPMIEVRDLRKSFSKDLFKEKQDSVKGLSMKFMPGTCTGLMGHNGAGKSTTIRIMLSLLKPDQGEVWFQGHSIQATDRAKIGYMPEASKLADKLTPYEILKTHLNLFPHKAKKGDPTPLIDEALKTVGLWDAKNKQARHFSKGMGRRLSWAQATIHDPELIILDEPFAGMDPLGRLKLQTWINDLKDRGKTVILCTHEITSAFELCDDFYILKKGTLAFSSKEGQKSSTYELTLDAHVTGDLDSFKGKCSLPPWISIEQESKRTTLTFSEASHIKSWVTALNSEGWDIHSFRKGHPVSRLELSEIFDHGGEQ